MQSLCKSVNVTSLRLCIHANKTHKELNPHEQRKCSQISIWKSLVWKSTPLEAPTSGVSCSPLEAPTSGVSCTPLEAPTSGVSFPICTFWELFHLRKWQKESSSDFVAPRHVHIRIGVVWLLCGGIICLHYVRPSFTVSPTQSEEFLGPATTQKVYQGIERFSQLAGQQQLTVLSMLIRGITITLRGAWHSGRLTALSPIMLCNSSDWG